MAMKDYWRISYDFSELASREGFFLGQRHSLQNRKGRYKSDPKNPLKQL
jgi:hypothetical protein